MRGREVESGNDPATACLGILMLETRFPRITGDIGNPETWPFPVRFCTVAGASPQRVVNEHAAGLLENFKDAATQLVRDGADGISTTCGFLSLFQNELAAACDAPVAASSLMQAPMIQALLPPGRKLGILTISAETLSPAHLAAAGVPEGTPVVGTDNGKEFSRAILNDEATLDVDLAEQDVVAAGGVLLDNNPDIGAILLECTNMAPYSRALQRAYNRPVFDIYSFLTWFHAGLRPRKFRADAEC
ncbi:MAG: aspartate/glutamate racemase family protein [Alphaproteobacteria bacterium]|nr:aspartate/glutamate racemase family protein [Alphaproteobacteria bacterium]